MLFSEFDEVAALCRDRTPEALQLEFKEKNSPDRHELDNGDKKVIAKAISAFANSGGGTLIFGIRTAKAGEIDVASELRPIADPELCCAQVEFVCKTNVSPEIIGLEVRALVGPSGNGVVICQVPASERRPHMSTAPGVHTYFRRTFQGDVPMTPFEVQEQVLAVREAVLEPSVTVGAGGTFSSMQGWITIGYGVQFGLRNIGARACLNPFLRVRSSAPPQTHGAYFDAALGMWKNNLSYGTIVHVDDAWEFFTLQFIARVFLDELALSRHRGIDEMLASIRLYGDIYDLHSKTVTDKSEIDGLEFDVKYGAENAVARTKTFALGRDEIAARIFVTLGETIRDMSIGHIGVWREDLIAQLKAQYP